MRERERERERGRERERRRDGERERKREREREIKVKNVINKLLQVLHITLVRVKSFTAQGLNCHPSCWKLALKILITDKKKNTFH